MGLQSLSKSRALAVLLLFPVMLLPDTSSRRRFGRLLRFVFALGWTSLLVSAQEAEIERMLPEHYFPALKTLLDGAVKQAPSVIERELELANSVARISMADSLRLPRLGGDFRYDVSQSSVSGAGGRTSRDMGVFYYVELSQSLFHWGALKNEGARARISQAIAEKNLAQTYALLAVSIRASFLDLIARKATLVQARYYRQILEDNLALERDRLTRGESSSSAVYSAELSVNQNSVELRRFEWEYSARLQALARIAGIPPLTDDDVPADIPAIPYLPEVAQAVLDGLLKSDARSSFEVQVLAMQVQDADLNYKIQKVRLLPKFNVAAGNSIENTNNVSGSAVNQQGIMRQYVSLRANWLIFDGFYTRGAKQEALGNKRIFERRLTTSVERILGDVRRMKEGLAVEAEALAMADIQRELAKGELARVNDEIGLGNLAPFQARAATSNLNGQIAANVAARGRLLNAWSEFISTAGIDPALKNLPDRYVRTSK